VLSETRVLKASTVRINVSQLELGTANSSSESRNMRVVGRCALRADKSVVAYVAL
jgi:hypothetical protein